MKLGFIGTGNMASAIMGGIIKNQIIPANDIIGADVMEAGRERGAERRETGRSLSGAGVGYLRGAVLSTRGPGWTDRWCTCWPTKAMAG